MKCLKNTIILYDAECPACDLYTKVFLKSGMLDSNGRIPFNEMGVEIAKKIDKKRACNEIALVDLEHNKVLYGTESLLEIIGHSFPLVKRLFELTPFRVAIKKLYSFISYNRKVIIPGKSLRNDDECIPDYNIKYRWTYIAFVWLLTSFVLNRYSVRLVPLIPSSTFQREFVICGGQLVFQWVYLKLRREKQIVHYLGNMMSVSLMGVLLLLPAFAFHHFDAGALIYAGWFMSVVAVMFLEHMRRVKIIGAHWSASLSWVIYRMIVLFIII